MGIGHDRPMRIETCRSRYDVAQSCIDEAGGELVSTCRILKRDIPFGVLDPGRYHAKADGMAGQIIIAIALLRGSGERPTRIL